MFYKLSIIETIVENVSQFKFVSIVICSPNQLLTVLS